MNNPLSNLKLDYWYHVLIVLGALFLLTSLTVSLEGVDNNTVQVLSLACILIGIGEWVNHPILTEIVPPSRSVPSGGELISHPRNNSIVGILFDSIGLFILALGLYLLFL
ncbi:hypothetical protein [Nitrincola sp. A-D6]|uniref:hypothetical protein n=1 Tax=Nitrincola sp. A-D6 TaxID=1545442 RepID=UPI001185ECBA|nr:hypothetical protein [Nitrincola sp. A-D6]